MVKGGLWRGASCRRLSNMMPAHSLQPRNLRHGAAHGPSGFHNHYILVHISQIPAFQENFQDVTQDIVCFAIFLRLSELY